MSRKGRINEFGEFIRSSVNNTSLNSSSGDSSEGAFLGMGFLLFIISLLIYCFSEISFGNCFLIALAVSGTLLTLADGAEGFAQFVVYGAIYSFIVYGVIWIFN